MNQRKLNQPLGGNEMPRFGAPATFMRLPAQPTARGLDACFVGVPMDIGTSNRPGTRFGPRQIRAESCFVRPYNMASRAAPFDSLAAGVGTLLSADRTLGGLCDWIEAEAPRPIDLAVDGAAALKAAVIPVVLHYASDDPLG